MNTDPLERKVRLPVKLIDGEWKLIDGESLPKIKEGAVGDIIIAAYSLCDEKVREHWVAEGEQVLFPSGTTLLVRVNYNKVLAQLKEACVDRKEWPGMPHRCVPITLAEDLVLTVRAGKHGTLKPCRCVIPSIEDEADSINEAYTKVSSAFEPDRRSHTGNVFQCVFFEEDGKVHPLHDRRCQAEGDKTDEGETDSETTTESDRTLFDSKG